MSPSSSELPPLAKQGRRMMILTEGHTEPVAAKTAACVIRYRKDEVVAILDRAQAGQTAQALLGVGGDIPVVADLAAAPEADTLLVGIAPSGGRVPPEWRAILREAICRGMDIVSGLHDFLSDDAELAELARQKGTRLVDVRKNHQRDVASGRGFHDCCLRVLTVGNDCSVGKMVAAVELARALENRGIDAKFVATGQTGIMIEGDGCPVDCVVSDFLNGAVENLVRANEHREVLVIEGQGSLAHPRYSPVSLGLLHGARPQGLVLCYEVGRQELHGMEPLPLMPLARLRDVHEATAALVHPTRVIGVAMNSRLVSKSQAEEERKRVESELGVPACDVLRHGPDVLVDAVLNLKSNA